MLPFESAEEMRNAAIGYLGVKKNEVQLSILTMHSLVAL
jgi:hypothetical protein